MMMEERRTLCLDPVLMKGSTEFEVSFAKMAFVLFRKNAVFGNWTEKLRIRQPDCRV